MQKRWFYHSVPWLLIMVQPFHDVRVNEPWRTFFETCLMVLSLIGPTIISVYAHFYVINRFLEKKKYVHYILGLLAVVFFYVFTVIFLLSCWGIVNHTYPREFFNILIILSITTGARYIKRGIQNRFRLQELEAKNARNELSALKAQINPHFLFNTLNNIYAINQTDPEKGSEMILELAEVLVYHMGHMKKEDLTLEEEIQLINSYIILEKLRLNDNCKLFIQLEPTNLQLEIAPLILMPFIENAFKHGTHPIKPCFIEIKLENYDRTVVLTVKNSVIKDRRVVKTHIGVENTKRRLELTYPGKHELVTQSDEECYSIRLSLQT
jgi:two-component system, LytTR family, sensor kinase